MFASLEFGSSYDYNYLPKQFHWSPILSISVSFHWCWII